MKIAIIGGGAAGMMAAWQASLNSELEVYLFEKNQKLGAKVLISGDGRCNVTTGNKDLKKTLKNYPRGAKFLRFAMYEFPPEKVYDFFEDAGVKLKTEEDLRVFPVSNDGSEIVGVFEDLKNKANVKIMFGSNIVDIAKNQDQFILTNHKGESIKFDKVIITTGGQAYAHTGSSGTGYMLAAKLGHSITELGPSLSSFVIDQHLGEELSGLSHIDVHFKSKLSDGSKIEFAGPIIWTHRGVSGPAVFAVSSLLAFEKLTKDAPHQVYLDLLPNLKLMELETQIFERVAKNPKKNLGNLFGGLIPRRLLQVLADKSVLNLEQNANEVSHKKLRKLVSLIKSYEIKIIGRGKGDEFVTAGGINLKEVDHKTMQSKICEGLYFAGEVLDIDGFTGGYNLQASWANGCLGGRSI